MVEKLPDSLLKKYYRWVREKGEHESMETLNEWVAEEVDFQMQASEVKHGFTSESEDSRKQDSNRWRRRDENGKSGKSFGANRQDENRNPGNESGRKEKPCKACGEKHTRVKSSKDGRKKNDRRLPNSLDYVFGV